MTKEVAEKIAKGITDKIECNTVDIDDWAEFWGFTREEYEEFLDMAIKALEKDIPKKPINKPDGFGLIIKVCPNCGIIVYDPDWTISTKKVYFTRRCQNCGQLFTKLGKYFGNWEDKE